MDEALAGADVSKIASETLSVVATLNIIQNDTLTSNKISLPYLLTLFSPPRK